MLDLLQYNLLSPLPAHPLVYLRTQTSELSKITINISAADLKKKFLQQLKYMTIPLTIIGGTGEKERAMEVWESVLYIRCMVPHLCFSYLCQNITSQNKTPVMQIIKQTWHGLNYQKLVYLQF